MSDLVNAELEDVVNELEFLMQDIGYRRGELRTLVQSCGIGKVHLNFDVFLGRMLTDIMTYRLKLEKLFPEIGE